MPCPGFATSSSSVFFCGSDADPEVVDLCRRRWRPFPNLAFTTLRLERAHESGEMQSLHADLVFASGGLHYLDEASLEEFFVAMRRWCPILLVSQPLDPSYDLESTAGSQPRRWLSWNHAYPLHLREAGWENVRAVEEQVPGSPERKDAVVFASDAAHARRAA
jgi:hypothetical protein